MNSGQSKPRVNKNGCTVGTGGNMLLAEVVTDYCRNTNRRKGGKTHQQHLNDDLKYDLH